jgi:hypothetical protein
VDLILTDEEYEKVELFKKEEAIHLALLSKHSMPKTQQISTTFRIGSYWIAYDLEGGSYVKNIIITKLPAFNLIESAELEEKGNKL